MRRSSSGVCFQGLEFQFTGFCRTGAFTRIFVQLRISRVLIIVALSLFASLLPRHDIHDIVGNAFGGCGENSVFKKAGQKNCETKHTKDATLPVESVSTRSLETSTSPLVVLSARALKISTNWFLTSRKTVTATISLTRSTNLLSKVTMSTIITRLRCPRR